MKLGFEQDDNAVEQIDGITYTFPYTMHRRDFSQFIAPWHWHEELEFDYAYQGSIIVETLNQVYTIHQGEAYFINTNVMNTKRKGPGQKSAMEYAHLFHPILLTGHYRSVFETKYLDPILKNLSIEVVIIRESTPSGRQFFKLLQQLTQLDGKVDNEFQIRNLLSQAWLALMDEINTQQQHALTTTPYAQERIKQMISFLHRHFDQKITVADIAAHVGVSEKECSRSFHKYFHQSPIDYLIQYRIDQAKQRLIKTDDPITAIALGVGFNNSAYFTKIFKQRTGLTPKEYRQTQIVN
ncbi:L-rhamnose operon transcriptional activator [Furfurilactobacillus rossiae]|uniref:AraC family transcriptional regulator n=1 Tax=Furfurilactobacillus rossiae TaxID=231049 RepID=UPI0015BB8796|nr:AraC family transcriptional regulator [Furfurilactobacillus rossiae]MCF6166701.1 AraC family transcriptional regulator [Furfurilactobacillus rossiae]QLE63352.1 L-rhamnose operon transcriptional activator [Furfurilactobacillus rossiae]